MPESRSGTSTFNRYGGIAVNNRTFYHSEGQGFTIATISNGETFKTSLLKIKVPNNIGFDSQAHLNGYNTIVNNIQPAYVGREGIILLVQVNKSYFSGSQSINESRSLIVVIPYLEDYSSLNGSYVYGIPQSESEYKYTKDYILTAPNCPWPYISAGYSDPNSTSDNLYVYEILKPLLPSYVTNNNEYPTYIVVR